MMVEILSSGLEEMATSAIGTSSPQGSLDVVSTTGAFIVPRMTTTQRNALTPVNGMIIYNTSMGVFQFRQGGDWESPI